MGQPIEINLVPDFREPIATPMTYGAMRNLRMSVDERAADVRWRVECLVARIRGRFSGVLPLFLPRYAELPDPETRIILRGLGHGPGVALIGTHFGLAGGGAVRRHSDRMMDDAVLEALVRAARERACEAGLRPVALHVPAEQVPAFEAGFGRPARVVAGDVQSRFELGGAADLAAFVAGQPWVVRRTLNGDLRSLARAGLRGGAEPLTPELIEEAAPLVAEVKVSNRMSEHPRLVVARLRRWAGYQHDSLIAFTSRDPGGSLLGASLGGIVGGDLEMYEIGLSDGDDRHLRYVELAFHAPLRYGLAAGLRGIRLGAGHAVTKGNRGARQWMLWHVIGDDDE